LEKQRQAMGKQVIGTLYKKNLLRLQRRKAVGFGTSQSDGKLTLCSS